MSTEVSVIICNYNNAEYIGRAIRSCLKQSFIQREVIIVDDASTDESREVIQSFGDQVRAIYLDQNVGVAEASNIGIRKALGQYVIRVDADDYISEHTLLFLYTILATNPDVGFTYGDIVRVGSDGQTIDRVNRSDLDSILRHGAGILFRKSYLEAIGLYRPELRNAEDFDLIKRYLINWAGYHLPVPLYRYRQHEHNMTRDIMERKRWEEKADENRQ